jgi:hypothetical protein
MEIDLVQVSVSWTPLTLGHAVEIRTYGVRMELTPERPLHDAESVEALPEVLSH